MGAILLLELQTTGEARRIASGAMTIGRASDNDWVLGAADGVPVSRHHCSFSASAEGCAVTDLGSTNGTRLNGRSLRPHAQTLLTSGDVVELGPYRFAITIETAVMTDLASCKSTDEPTLARPTVRPASVATSARTKREEPPSIEDLLGTWAAAEPAPTGPRPNPSKSVDVDPLADFLDRLDPLPESRSDRAEEKRLGAGFQPQLEALATGARMSLSSATGPLGILSENPFGMADPGQSGPLAPTATGAEPPPSTPQTRLSSDTSVGDNNALVAAFLEGAGIDPQTMRIVDARAFMHEAGTAFSCMSQGIRELLSVRTLIKNHARLSQTQIRARDNNPLKFSADAREATQALLQPKGQGYMPAVAAIEAACRDLAGHELALLDGIQAAVAKLLQSFDPANLEARLGHTGNLALLVQGGRCAKLWELYGEYYGEIAGSARARFMGDFDQAFRAAYERKVGELSAALPTPIREVRG